MTIVGAFFTLVHLGLHDAIVSEFGVSATVAHGILGVGLELADTSFAEGTVFTGRLGLAVTIQCGDSTAVVVLPMTFADSLRCKKEE